MKKVTILGTNHFVPTTVTGPLDVFSLAGLLWNYICGVDPTPHFEVEVVTTDGKPFKCLSDIIYIQPNRSIDDVESTDLVIISSVSDIDGLLMSCPKLVDWIKKHHRQGANIASICTGAFLLAETGLLNGKTATTHWGFAKQFSERYPRVSLKPERLITDEGNLFCSGGLTSGIDLSLYLVEKYCGREVAIQCSKAMIHDTGRSSQAPYSIFHFQKNHRDELILSVQRWIEKNYAEQTDYEIAAKRFGISRRTYERRFKLATGDTPLVYLQRVRIEAAKKLLEEDNHTIDEISFKVGYMDSGSFRKIFIRHTGLTPKDYKNRFLRADNIL